MSELFGTPSEPLPVEREENGAGDRVHVTEETKLDILQATGDRLAEADDVSDAIIYADLDLAWARSFRAGFGFFRDRRPDLYGPLLTLDGRD